MIDFIQDVAREAGQMLFSHFREDAELLKQRATAKEAATRYDRLADELIISRIRDAYPSHSLLTEESGRIEGDADWLWIIDSLDGTGNFANSNPMFAVCIALVHMGHLYLGTVYAPAIDEFYFALKGGGAYLNDKKITVSDVAEPEDSYFLYCEGGSKDRKRTGATLDRVYPGVKDIRKLGSAGLETAWVAAGRVEAYYTTDIDPWDVAAGVLLVEEAGGRVTDFKGNPWQPERSDLIFSNGRVHRALLEKLQG
jgi:myo-inositol-1(or 4)-monophosphatase